MDDWVVVVAEELEVVLRKEDLEHNMDGCRELRGRKARAAWAMAKLSGKQNTHMRSRE